MFNWTSLLFKYLYILFYFRICIVYIFYDNDIWYTKIYDSYIHNYSSTSNTLLTRRIFYKDETEGNVMRKNRALRTRQSCSHSLQASSRVLSGRMRVFGPADRAELLTRAGVRRAPWSYWTLGELSGLQLP